MKEMGIPFAAIVSLQQFAEYIPVMTGRELCAILEGRLSINARQVAAWAERMQQMRPLSAVGAVEEAISRQHQR